MMMTSENICDIATALSQCQGEMGGAEKGADNPFFNSKYADITSVLKAIKEPLANTASALCKCQYTMRTRLASLPD